MGVGRPCMRALLMTSCSTVLCRQSLGSGLRASGSARPKKTPQPRPRRHALRPGLPFSKILLQCRRRTRRPLVWSLFSSRSTTRNSPLSMTVSPSSIYYRLCALSALISNPGGRSFQSRGRPGWLSLPSIGFCSARRCPSASITGMRLTISSLESFPLGPALGQAGKARSRIRRWLPDKICAKDDLQAAGTRLVLLRAGAAL
mmetsp:Transcript_21140/g.45373  ORF Transcript_21140/g.45373 Transcript_21140/m.45373 type:complete len:202 (-) Transcript_21140:40-645(-)